MQRYTNFFEWNGQKKFGVANLANASINFTNLFAILKKNFVFSGRY